MWCCAQFQWHCEMAGERGLAVIVDNATGKVPAFLIQFRALDPGVSPPVTDTPLSIVSETGILFCPWCGCNLRDWYKKTAHKLEKPGLRIPFKEDAN